MAVNSINPVAEAPQQKGSSALQNAATAMGILGSLASVGKGLYDSNLASNNAVKSQDLMGAQTAAYNRMANMQVPPPNNGLNIDPLNPNKFNLGVKY